jgi:hypothetical protein
MLTTVMAFLLGTLIGQILILGSVILYYYIKCRVVYKVKAIYFIPFIGGWFLADYGLDTE